MYLLTNSGLLFMIATYYITLFQKSASPSHPFRSLFFSFVKKENIINVFTFVRNIVIVSFTIVRALKNHAKTADKCFASNNEMDANMALRRFIITLLEWRKSLNYQVKGNIENEAIY